MHIIFFCNLSSQEGGNFGGQGGNFWRPVGGNFCSSGWKFWAPGGNTRALPGGRIEVEISRAKKIRVEISDRISDQGGYFWSKPRVEILQTKKL